MVSIAVELALEMRLEPVPFVSWLPFEGWPFDPNSNMLDGLGDQTGNVWLCVFPGIFKECHYLAQRYKFDTPIIKAAVRLDSEVDFLV